MQTESKILLVDDEPLVRRSMQKSLQRAGFEVETAGDCAEGLAVFEKALAAAPFTLAVIDLNMPAFDGSPREGAGLELLAQLVEQQPGLPVVVLTAYDDVARAKEALRYGARNYFVKGREQGLIALIHEILR